jgi:hypothetical protein
VLSLQAQGLIPHRLRKSSRKPTGKQYLYPL